MVVLPESMVISKDENLDNDTYMFKPGVWRYPQLFNKFADKPDMHGKSNYGLRNLLCTKTPAKRPAFDRRAEANCKIQPEWKKVATCSKAEYNAGKGKCINGIHYDFGISYPYDIPQFYLPIGLGTGEQAGRRFGHFVISTFLRLNRWDDMEEIRCATMPIISISLICSGQKSSVKFMLFDRWLLDLFFFL